jgi:hypothetical protein
MSHEKSPTELSAHIAQRIEQSSTPEAATRTDILRHTAQQLTQGYLDDFTKQYQPAFTDLLDSHPALVTEWTDVDKRKDILAFIINTLTADNDKAAKSPEFPEAA